MFYHIKGVIPRSYECSECRATKCKLWLDQSDNALKCVECVSHANFIHPRIVDENGNVLKHKNGNVEHRTPIIGNCIPAIPDRRNKGFVLYEDSGARERLWWIGLPNQRTHPQELFFE